MELKKHLLFALAIPAFAAIAFAAGGGGGGARAGTRGGAPASLLGSMQDMQTMVLALKKDAADPDKIEQTLKTLAQLERDIAIAKMQRPPVDRVPDAEKGLVDYRTFMTVLQRTALDLEDAVVAKKPDEIKKLIAKFDELEQAGHDEFR